MNLKKNKYLMALALFAAAICVVLVVSLQGHDERIKIGFVTALSGDAAPWGIEAKNGAMLAYEEIKDIRIDGQKIELLFEDDRCDAKSGLSAIQKLINIDGVKITGGTVCSSVALSIAPVTEENSIVHLSTGASSPVLSHAGDYMFRVWPSDDLEAKKIAEFAAEKLDIASVGILYLNNDYGVGLKEAFVRSFEKQGGIVETTEGFEPNANDYRTQLLKMVKADVDAIYFVSNPAEAPLILKQIRELGISKTILANGPAVEASTTLETAIDYAEGVIYALPKQETSDGFKERYRAKYGREPGLVSDTGYDVIMLLFRAIHECNGDDSDCIKAYLYEIENYKGASATITFDEKGDVVVPSVIKHIKDGKAAIYE